MFVLLLGLGLGMWGELFANLVTAVIADRIRNDWNTYAVVELSLVELLNTGVIQAAIPEKGDRVSNVVAYAFTLYTNANLTVQNNKPSTYVGSKGNATSTLEY